MIDTKRNPNGWSDEALDVFWNTYLSITDLTLAEVFHHPEFRNLTACVDEDIIDKINDTIAWNAAWTAAEVVDGRE